MELGANLPQPRKKPVGPFEPSHRWVLGLAVDDDDARIGSRIHVFSYLAECNCPDDCLRDHENE